MMCRGEEVLVRRFASQKWHWSRRVKVENGLIIKDLTPIDTGNGINGRSNFLQMLIIHFVN